MSEEFFFKKKINKKNIGDQRGKRYKKLMEHKRSKKYKWAESLKLIAYKWISVCVCIVTNYINEKNGENNNKKNYFKVGGGKMPIHSP